MNFRHRRFALQPAIYGVPAVASGLMLDGTPQTANTGGATSISVTLSTVGSSGRVVVFVEANGPITSVSGGGLTWTRRATIGGATPMEEWTAPYSSQLSSAVITANLSGTVFATIGAFAVSGGVGGFDSNGALPSTSASSTVSITTTAANTFIYAGYRFSNPNPTAGGGWTQIFGGANFFMVEYQIVSAAQSGTVATIGVENGNENGGIGDAIK